VEERSKSYGFETHAKRKTKNNEWERSIYSKGDFLVVYIVAKTVKREMKGWKIKKTSLK